MPPATFWPDFPPWLLEWTIQIQSVIHTDSQLRCTPSAEIKTLWGITFRVFFINDGALFPDLVYAVKVEPDKGFPTGQSVRH